MTLDQPSPCGISALAFGQDGTPDPNTGWDHLVMGRSKSTHRISADGPLAGGPYP